MKRLISLGRWTGLEVRGAAQVEQFTDDIREGLEGWWRWNCQAGGRPQRGFMDVGKEDLQKVGARGGCQGKGDTYLQHILSLIHLSSSPHAIDWIGQLKKSITTIVMLVLSDWDLIFSSQLRCEETVASTSLRCIKKHELKNLLPFSGELQHMDESWMFPSWISSFSSSSDFLWPFWKTCSDLSKWEVTTSLV